MTIEVYKVFKKQKINGLDDGARLFNLIKTNADTNKDDLSIILDMKDVIVFGEIPFKTLISKMRVNLEGQYQVQLVNHNQFIDKAFKNSLR